ncbi:MAG TPA: alkyl sulfatase dimerization domain-containing protein [Gammaproteobacteria bacterium]|nr:alkyl sulfatase dimerization domain-containing protein [Gammaproteobacteria bacterium]
MLFRTGALSVLLSLLLIPAYAQTNTTDQTNNTSSQPIANLVLPKEASPETQQMNAAVMNALPFANREDYDLAKRGFVGTSPDLTITNAAGQVVWSLKSYAFLTTDKVPDTVNPSLWRQAQINMNNGLYKVTDRVYQVRGYDLSNMDIIEGDTGLIIIDPLVSKETARAALELYYQNRPKKPIVAVIYTHSHVDHYGGVKGVITEEEVKAGKVMVLAPEGFLEHAISENVYAGNAMSRRAIYMYGAFLPKGEKGQVDGALGKTTSLGEITLIPPTETVKKTGEKRTIDGVEIEFLMAPNTEAPAEMIMYFPQFKALCIAEDANHTMHNIYTLRGAEVRDAAAWWKALNDAIELFGQRAEVVFSQHTWPVWGQAELINFLEKQRDLYKYIHDQTLHLINQGHTLTEVGNLLTLPPSLANEWFNRGYYGSVSHNAKAIYQYYLGWYNSNPASLNQLSPVESGKRYVEFMGGSAAVIAKAQAYYKKGDYRWVAEVMNHVVFAEPNNKEARALQADALEQLGYQSENATWRNEYLMAAFELRNGKPKTTLSTVSVDTIKAMPISMYLDYMGICLDGKKAAGKKIKLNLNFTDTKERYALILQNSVLIYTENKQFPDADATLNLTRDTFNDLTLKRKTHDKAIDDGSIKISGQREKMTELMSLIDDFPLMFNIVTPN